MMKGKDNLSKEVCWNGDEIYGDVRIVYSVCNIYIVNVCDRIAGKETNSSKSVQLEWEREEWTERKNDFGKKKVERDRGRRRGRWTDYVSCLDLYRSLSPGVIVFNQSRSKTVHTVRIKVSRT
jgi:hypothetical protein